MDLTDAGESRPACSERLLPQIGPNHQVTMPPLKQSARIASMEYINRDQWYACGLPVSITYIATPRILRKCRSHIDQDKSVSFTSTTTLRSTASHFVHQEQEQELHELRLPQEPKFPCADAVVTKDTNSCASSSKEASSQSGGWRREESSARTVLADALRASGSERQREAMMDNVPGVSSQSELKSSITSEAQGSIMVKKKKKRRSCWQTLKRRGNKKSKMEKGRKERRWAPLQSSETGAAARQGRLGALAGGSCYVLPGCHPDSWSEGEIAAFTLGLYLFDKDFSSIERFMESKKMSDILHFYYGEFYRSPAFSRWAGSKNRRNRKCVHGPRILQGWRQDELLRRLHPHFPDACKDGIQEVVQSFNDRQLTVEGLAMELKAAVGLEVLVRCFGIGMSKRDLTAVHGDPGKQVYHPGAASGRMEVASVEAAAAAKGCSMLSKEETLECLAGDVRFSKTRSHNLFWDSVWPRLLSHGWQSMECEAPALGWPGSRTSFAFLRPGVEKLVRGSSEKGIHYFDSASEVLEAVAVDPSLLDGSELTGDTIGGSDDQEEDEMQGWSDDMFETLDMHRLRPTKGRADAGSKQEHQVAFKAAVSSPSEDHVAQESSESSPVDIDLNRPLSVVCSKPELDEGEETENIELHPAAAPASTAATHHHRFPIEEIDLNLPPVDPECNFPPFSADTYGEVPADIQNGSSSYFLTSSSITSSTLAPGASDGRRSSSLMEEINLNDPLPLSDLALMEETVIDMSYRPGPEVQHHATKIVGGSSMPSLWIAAEADTEPASAAAAASELSSGKSTCDRAAASSTGLSNACKCLSRKRSLDNRERGREAQGEMGAGKELVPVCKKRATRYNFPFRLDGIGSPALFFSVQMSKFAGWPRTAKSKTFGWKNDFRVSLPKFLATPCVPEEVAAFAELQPLNCRVVEVDKDVEEAVDTSADPMNRALDLHVQGTFSTKAAQVKRLKCHFSEAEVALPSSNSRSRLQRLPRKFTISFDSGSDGNHLTKTPGEGRCIDWKWSRGGGIMTTSCSFNSHGSPVAEECYADDGRTTERARSDFHHDGSWCTERDDFDPRKKPADWGGHRKASSGALGMKENVPEIDRAKSLPEAWEVPSYTSTSCAPDSYHHRTGDLPRPGARSRGIRSRLHSQSVPSKSTGERRIFSFGSAKKRGSIEDREFEMSKKVKLNGAAYSLRNRDMSEHELLITLCSMQKHVEQGAIAANEAMPKVKGKRSPRIRRRNFNFKFIIVEGGQADDVEEGLFVQPCTSQGPWQPTCHLPSTDKIQRTPKLRRRRSGLPCKGSCVVAAPAAITPSPSGSSKTAGSASKGQPGSRLPGQTLPADEEAVPLNWPVHDVRFSLRRASSDGVLKTDRQNGRKIPARWNHFSVC